MSAGFLLQRLENNESLGRNKLSPAESIRWGHSSGCSPQWVCMLLLQVLAGIGFAAAALCQGPGIRQASFASPFPPQSLVQIKEPTKLSSLAKEFEILNDFY